VVNHQAGVFEPDPEGIAALLARWFSPGDTTLRTLAENTRRIAYPNATFDIASEIAAMCAQPRVSVSLEKPKVADRLFSLIDRL